MMEKALGGVCVLEPSFFVYALENFVPKKGSSAAPKVLLRFIMLLDRFNANADLLIGRVCQEGNLLGRQFWLAS